MRVQYFEDDESFRRALQDIEVPKTIDSKILSYGPETQSSVYLIPTKEIALERVKDVMNDYQRSGWNIFAYTVYPEKGQYRYAIYWAKYE